MSDVRPCRCSEPGAAEWLGDVELPTLSAMLTTIFYQCVECLADCMWELRRMAAQVQHRLISYIASYLHQGGYVFIAVCLFVCLFVC